jgi:hypothetical protein
MIRKTLCGLQAIFGFAALLGNHLAGAKSSGGEGKGLKAPDLKKTGTFK